MKVEFWYKPPTYQSKQITRHTSMGLIVDDVKFTWAEVELKWGVSGKRFSKRFHANPDWTMERLLTEPFKRCRAKSRGKNKDGSAGVQRNQTKRMAHSPEQLEANQGACVRWK